MRQKQRVRNIHSLMMIITIIIMIHISYIYNIYEYFFRFSPIHLFVDAVANQMQRQKQFESLTNKKRKNKKYRNVNMSVRR